MAPWKWRGRGGGCRAGKMARTFGEPVGGAFWGQLTKSDDAERDGKPAGDALRRTLWSDTLDMWQQHQTLCADTVLDDNEDRTLWPIGPKGHYSVHSMYLAMHNYLNKFDLKFIWQMKVPMKVKVFLWLMIKDSIFTKDKLKKRGWSGNQDCYLCGGKETVQHLFFRCSVARYLWSVIAVAFGFSSLPFSVDQTWDVWLNCFTGEKRKLVMVGCAALCWSIWKTRNAICFDKKKVNDPTNIVHFFCYWVSSWAILQKEGARGQLLEGADWVRRVSLEIFKISQGWMPGVRRLCADDQDSPLVLPT